MHLHRQRYLAVHVRGPEAGGGTVVGVGGEERRAAGEGLVDIVHDDLRLGDRLAAVDEHGHLLVHGVGGEEELAILFLTFSSTYS